MLLSPPFFFSREEIYNPTCADVHTLKHHMGLELLFCRSSEDVDDENGIRNSKHCITKKAGLESVIPRLQTLVVCSGLGPRSGKTSGDDKCDLHVRSLLAGNEKLHLAEVKLLRSNGKHVVDRVGDNELLSSKEVTLKKYSEFSEDDTLRTEPQPKKKQGVREVNSIWLYKPYATYSFLGCHSTKHEKVCQDVIPQICPPADLDRFRTFSVQEIGASVSCEASSAPDIIDSSNGSCASNFNGETVSTFGYIADKIHWQSAPNAANETKSWWIFTLRTDSQPWISKSRALDRTEHQSERRNQNRTHSSSETALRVALQLPGRSSGGGESIDLEMRRSWLNGLQVGNKISVVGRLSVDEYGIVMDKILKMGMLDRISSAEKLLPGGFFSQERQQNAEQSRNKGQQDSRTTSALKPLVITMMAMSIVAFLISTALFILIQFKRHSHPSGCHWYSARQQGQKTWREGKDPQVADAGI